MERSHRISKVLGVVLAVTALVVLLLWMQGIIGGEKIEPGEIVPPVGKIEAPVEYDVVKRSTFVNFEEAVGTVQAKREVLISAKIMEAILELPVKEGDHVEEGQLLVRLDDRDIQARMEQARSAMVEAESEFARASADYKRFKRLRSQRAVPEQKFEAVQAAYRAALARLKRAREAVKEAKINLGYTTIRAPVTGYVVEKHMEVGDMASPGRPILTLQEAGSLRLEAAVREGLAGEIPLGTRLRVRIDALDLELLGTVEEKVPVADPRSRSFLVKVSLPQKPGLRSGMFGRLYIPTGSITPLTVSRKAIERIGQLELAWVPSEDGKPERRYVRTGRIYGDRVEVLSGLHEGEKVVVISRESTDRG